MGNINKRPRLLLKIKILSGMLVTMFCFFNCGQPGDLQIVGTNSNIISGDVPNSPIGIPTDTPPTVQPSPPPVTVPGLNEVINNMKPALVVRATGCIMCHSNIASNIITDFGYGGDGKGRNYFFGGYPNNGLPAGLTNTKGKSVYGDYDYSTGGNVNWGGSTLTAGVEVIVPKASTTGLDVEQSSLALYLKNILDRNINANGAQVKEVTSLHIGAPTADKIISVSGVDAGGIKYKPTKNDTSLVGLGLSDTRKYYTNKPQETIVCDGDVAIDGILWLNQPTIKTESGCRLYVTGSVFISGPITYVDVKANSNLQITSSKMVALGIGHSCNNDQKSDSIEQRFTPGSSSDSNRYNGFFTRTLGQPLDMLAHLKAEANLVGLLKDATCGSGGRAIGFERLMVNAPIVHNRYQGRFKGLIISEIALLALKSLVYEFDPVFSNPKVLILPLLKNSDYLEIQEN